MGRGRIVLAGGVAAIAAAALLLGGALNEAPAPASADAATSPFATFRATRSADTAAVVRHLEQALRISPDDSRTAVLLGLGYQQRFRETADADYLRRSERGLRLGLRLAPGDAQATSGLASLALARHQFANALTLGRAALALAPDVAAHHGIVGDALVELGRYGEAFAAFDRMAELKPGLGSYARVAYGRELLGRPRAAIEAMELAVAASGGRGEPAAWAEVELGKLYFSVGELRAAGRHFRTALLVFPGYVHALEALARAEAASGRLLPAIELARRAVETVPLPQFAGTLGDLYGLAGRAELARTQYGLVRAVDRVLRANGVRTDLELALFDVDHGFRLADALARVRAAHRERPSIQADDALAWALARTGRCTEALSWSKRALRLGTRDATMFFHRGMVERCLGRHSAAAGWLRRALDVNPHFSPLWAPVARRYAE